MPPSERGVARSAGGSTPYAGLPPSAGFAILRPMPTAHPDFLLYRHDLVSRARALRSDMTDQERRLWYGWLRKMPFRFQRQKPIGGYIADFYCHRAKLVVEIDGWRHFTEEGQDSDNRRTAFLESQGLLVLRYRGHAVDNDIAAVAAQIEQVAHERIASLAR